MRAWLVSMLVIALLVLVYGLVGESDVESARMARYLAARAHCDAAMEAGRL